MTQTSPTEQRTILPSGMRVVTERLEHVDSVSLGAWLGAGVCQEQAGQEGLTHLIEHMLFKGTRRRTARQIAEEIDGVGGYLNAFTDREYTCVTARIMSDHLPLALDVVCDMLAESVFSDDDLGREKQVVMEEIKRYEDSPDELVHDLVQQSLWEGHPLGLGLLGNENSVSGTTRESLLGYYRQHYRAPNITIAAAGNLEHDRVVEAVTRLLPQQPGDGADPPPPPSQPTRKTRYVPRPTEQAHFCLAWPAFSYSDENTYPQAILDAVLGASPSSRLFQTVREERGLVYNIGSYPIAFRNAGAFVVTASVSPSNLDEVLKLVGEECGKMAESVMHEKELQRAKEQILGGLALAAESTSFRMRRLAMNEMYLDRSVGFEEVRERVRAITGEQVRSVAERVLTSPSANLVAIGPFQNG
jgi:predicted Zn-dependent peptidase